ncbi:MAG: hypothetical protein AAFY83_05850, partial [Pseudomonadota bacterium]
MCSNLLSSEAITTSDSHAPIDEIAAASTLRPMRPSILNALFRDTTSLTGVGPKVAALINKVAGPRLVNLILTPPAGLIDRSFRPKIAEAQAGGLATMLVQIDRHEPAPNRRQPYRVICSDETGFLTLVFFHARTDYLNRALPEG